MTAPGRVGRSWWLTAKAERALDEAEVADVTFTPQQRQAMTDGGYDVFYVDALPLLGLVAT